MRLVLLALQERGSLSFVPVVAHAVASAEIGRADWAAVLWWELAGLQEPKSESALGSCTGFGAGAFANVLVGVDETECC